MTVAGLLITAFIVWLKILIFACFTGLPVAGVFYLSKINRSVQLIPEKISEGE
jgi:energy-converting hydrogenase Eha subunit B